MKRNTKKKAQDYVMQEIKGEEKEDRKQGTFDDRLKYSNYALDTYYRVSTTIHLPCKQRLY